MVSTSSRGAKSDNDACGSRKMLLELPRARLIESLADGAVISPPDLTHFVMSLICSLLSRIGQLRPDLPITSSCFRSDPWSQLWRTCWILPSSSKVTMWICTGPS